MASVTGVNTAVSQAQLIDKKWADFINHHRDANLQAAKHFRDFSSLVSQSGNTVYVPNNLVEQTPYSYTEGGRLSDNLQANTETYTTLTLSVYKANPFLISDKLNAQSKYASKMLGYKKASYAVAKALDTALLALGSSSTLPDVNDGGSTITNLDLTECQVRLDTVNVPEEDRAWFLYPWVLKDLMDLSGNYFTSLDFGQNGPMIKGQINKMLLGSPVYKTTNVPQTTAGSPAQPLIENLYAHKDFAIWAANFKDQKQEEYNMDLQGTLCNVRSLYGVAINRTDHGIRLERQSTTA
jgi:hypothetical protein